MVLQRRLAELLHRRRWAVAGRLRLAAQEGRRRRDLRPHLVIGQDLLAYTAKTEQGDWQPYLYNPSTGESAPLAEGMEVEAWSPDGKYLALAAPDPRGYSIFAIDPSTQRQLFVGQFDERGLGLAGLAAE